MKILIVDTYYPVFIHSLSVDPGATYEAELQSVLRLSFGTADFVSRNLRHLGWDASDIIYNHTELQLKWCNANGMDAARIAGPNAILLEQIRAAKPDIVFLQDLSIPDVRQSGKDYLIAAQCSCPWPGDANIRKCDVIFTSFPHFVPRIEALGVRAVYNPLAFEPSVRWPFIDPVSALYNFGKRDHGCTFIGGVGNPSHWKRGMETLEAVARGIPSFKWWGYGGSELPMGSKLRWTHQSHAWGLDMYDILLRSKIVVNRHGEVAEGYANNMRLFEATGCGALLLTEAAPNLSDFFAPNECVAYSSPEDAVMKIKYYLEHESERAAIAARGQRRTLKDHTYAQRMKTVSDVLKEMLVAA